MKKVLLMLLVASLYLISCTKSGTIGKQDEQRSKRITSQQLAVLAESLPLGEDNIISVDSVKPVIENVGFGYNVYWATHDATLFPTRYNVFVQVFIPENYVDKWGNVNQFGHDYWSAIGNAEGSNEKPSAGNVFDGGVTTATDPRLYRAVFVDKVGTYHYSSPYQFN